MTVGESAGETEMIAAPKNAEVAELRNVMETTEVAGGPGPTWWEAGHFSASAPDIHASSY